jgi:hypothetical protein
MANTTIPATSKELLARVDEGWRGFREAVRHIGPAKMEEPTGAGWTFHDLVAHVAGWHDLTARRLRAFRTTGAFPGPGDETALGIPAFKDADEFNARLVSSHQLVEAEALVDEVDTTFRALRGELAPLTDEQVHANDDWVIAIVAGDSYGHYAEHATELGR